jgi:beta-galactosidase
MESAAMPTNACIGARRAAPAVTALFMAFLSAGCTTAAGPGPRLTLRINDNWQYQQGESEEMKPPGGPWRNISLPHTWNALDGQDGGDDYFRGPGWYRKTVRVDPRWRDKRVVLRFQGAFVVTDVYWNGEHVGEHRGGFAAFAFDVTRYVRFNAPNSLLVRVSNARYDDVPPLSADFTFFGGIYRSVDLLVLEPVCICPTYFGSPGVFITPRLNSDGSASVEVKTLLSSARNAPAQVRIRTRILDARSATVCDEAVDASVPPAGESTIQQTLGLAVPHLWQARRDPYLYRVVVELSETDCLLDRVEQPLGFRTFEVDPERGFILNGRHYDIHGACMHQDRLNRGWARTESDIAADMKFVLDLGCTAVRLAHYQHNQVTYDLCDRSGIVVWTEIPLINEITASQAFTDNCRQQLCELILQNYNHPSVCFWGLHNEITLRRDGRPDQTALIHELQLLAKQLDSTRLTTCAAAGPVEHPANWQADVMACNLYFGWYNGRPADFAPWIDALFQARPGRAIGVSEYGAGANVAQHEDPPFMPKHDGLWHPVEWQLLFHREHWRMMQQRPRLWCKFVWNLFDFASDGRNEGGVPGRNDKGLVTYDRGTKKPAYDFYRAEWISAPDE